MKDKPSVLFADDHPGMRKLVTRVLRERYTILAVSDATEACHVMRHARGDLDLVVTDGDMPGGGGAEVIRYAHAFTPPIRVILFSGHVPPHHDADAAVEKPNVNELLDTIERLLTIPVEIFDRQTTPVTASARELADYEAQRYAATTQNRQPTRESLVVGVSEQKPWEDDEK